MSKSENIAANLALVSEAMQSGPPVVARDYTFATIIGTLEGEIKGMDVRRKGIAAERTETAWLQYLAAIKGLAPLRLAKKSVDRTDAMAALVAAHVSPTKAERLVENTAWLLQRNKPLRQLALTMPSDASLRDTLKEAGYEKERDITLAREGRKTPVEAVMNGIRKFAKRDGFDYKGFLAEVAARLGEEISSRGHVPAAAEAAE